VREIGGQQRAEREYDQISQHPEHEQENQLRVAADERQ
jgi:hypothetical protein